MKSVNDDSSASSSQEKLPALEKAAVRGDAEAQYRPGCLYENGEGVPRDAVN